MAAKNAKHAQNHPASHPHTVKIVGVSTKENFRRPVPKTYSYRYEVVDDAGPAGQPLVRAGAAIIESRYRGRGATWNMARSVTEPQTYLVRGGYVHPLEENPMAYPPRSVLSPEASAQQRPTPGFAQSAANKIERPRLVAPSAPAVPPPVAAPAAAVRRNVARPTPANESVYKKTG
jgi:hypothetical protein